MLTPFPNTQVVPRQHAPQLCGSQAERLSKILHALNFLKSHESHVLSTTFLFNCYPYVNDEALLRGDRSGHEQQQCFDQDRKMRCCFPEHFYLNCILMSLIANIDNRTMSLATISVLCHRHLEAATADLWFSNAADRLLPLVRCADTTSPRPLWRIDGNSPPFAMPFRPLEY